MRVRTEVRTHKAYRTQTCPSTAALAAKPKISSCNLQCTGFLERPQLYEVRLCIRGAENTNGSDRSLARSRE